MDCQSGPARSQWSAASLADCGLEVAPRRGRPRILVESLAAALCPQSEMLAQARKVLRGRLGDAEVDEGEPLG